MSIHRSFVFFFTKEGLRTIELVVRSLESKNAKNREARKLGCWDAEGPAFQALRSGALYTMKKDMKKTKKPIDFDERVLC